MYRDEWDRPVCNVGWKYNVWTTLEYSSSCILSDGSRWQDTFLPSVKGVATSYMAFLFVSIMCLVCVYTVWMVRVNSWQISTQVCCFVLLTRYWGIVTVPGFPLRRAKEHPPTKCNGLTEIASLPSPEGAAWGTYVQMHSFFLSCDTKTSSTPSLRPRCTHKVLASKWMVDVLCTIKIISSFPVPQRYFVQEDLLSHEYSPPRPSVSRTNSLVKAPPTLWFRRNIFLGPTKSHKVFGKCRLISKFTPRGCI